MCVCVCVCVWQFLVCSTARKPFLVPLMKHSKSCLFFKIISKNLGTSQKKLENNKNSKNLETRRQTNFKTFSSFLLFASVF